MRPPGGPEQLTDYLNRQDDRPILGLYILSFTDSTLVTLSCSHVVLDEGGRKSFLEAWSLVLQGRISEVPPLHGYRDDPLAILGSNATESYLHKGKLMTTRQTARFVVRTLYHYLTGKSLSESRMICIPAPFVAQLRARAMSELASEAKEPFWLSAGDVFCG